MMQGGFFDEYTRRQYIRIAAALSFLSIIPSIGLIFFGSYTYSTVQQNIRLLKDFNTFGLPLIIAFVALYSVLHNCISLMVMLSLALPKNRYTRMKLVCLELISGVLLSIVFFILAIGCYVQIDFLDRSFHGGLIEAMKLYRKSPLIKKQLDKLQIEYECCGSANFTDWFRIDWRNPEYVIPSDGPVFTPGGLDPLSQYLHDDAPFSCCKVNASRPCINHHVFSPKHHYNYNFEIDLTLSIKGCRNSLVDFYGHDLMTMMGIMIAALVVLQAGVIYVTRYLQTSINEAILKEGDATDPAMGYLCLKDDGMGFSGGYGSGGMGMMY